MNQLNHPAFALGAPVLNRYGKRGYIVAIATPAHASYLLGGAGGFQPVGHELTIAFPDGLQTLPDSSVAPMMRDALAAGMAPCDCADDARAAAQSATAERVAARNAERDEKAISDAAFYAAAESRVPAWAESVIVAELMADKSDSMTDYYGGSIDRRVILGFSRHNRDLFPELRKAAAAFIETVGLVDAPASAEHREKYSMGGGFYLKEGTRYSDGWRVSKSRLSHGHKSLPVAAWAEDLAPAVSVPESSPAREAAPGAAFAIEAHIHTKKGFPMWICVTPERVGRAAFDAFRDRAQSVGGWYSRPWGRTPGGFAFKVESDAHEFAGIGAGIDAAAPVTMASAAPVAAPAAKPGANLAERLRDIADGLESPISDAFRDRLANTPKRQRQAAKARNAGYDLQRAQKAALALAAAHDAGAVPAVLASVKTKAQLIDLASERRIHDGGYYDAGRGTGKPRSDTPAAAALWALLDGGGVDPAAVAAEALRQKIAGLQFANIPGYFPTPAAVVARMIDAADIAPGHLVLEPSAGSGAILDAIHDACPGAVLECYEKSFTLFEILQAKGYTIAGRDFVDGAGTAGHYDRILMNPPFEGGQDAAHIRLAFDLLKEGGRLVAIMSPGPFFRSDSKSQAFRDWFDAMGGDRETLPAGSFKESGTGVETLMIELRK